MNTPAQGLAWQIWGRNRLGLCAMLGGLVLAGLVVRLIPEEMRSGDAVKYVVLGSVMVFCYPISIFTYSNIGPGRVHQSLRFPRPMFHLPVPTWMLVAVPMLAGMVFCALLWTAMEALVIRPFGVELPFTLPALGLAAALGFFQALAWSPFGASLLRASVATVLGTGAVQLALWACLKAEAPVERPWLLLCGCIALAYAGALFGVSRDRRGGSSGGPGIAPRALEWVSGVLPRRGGGFASGLRAQAWFDLRTKGLVYVLLGGTLALLPLVDSLFLRFRGESGSLLLFGFGTLTPLWSAALLGPYFAKPSLWGQAYALPGFTAVRPLTTGELYLATLRAALWSVLALWALMAVVTALRLVVAGTPEGLDSTWAMALERHGSFGVGLRVAGLAAALVVLTLASLVGGLTVGLAGRTWVATGGMFFKCCLAGITLWTGQAILARVVARPDLEPAALGLIAGLVLAKTLSAGWVFRMSLRRGWMDRRTAGVLVLGWLCGAALLGTLAFGCLPPGAVPLPPPGLALGAALLLPLVQPALGPAALAWNRHR